jgi:hypothetical protein
MEKAANDDQKTLNKSSATGMQSNGPIHGALGVGNGEIILVEDVKS